MYGEVYIPIGCLNKLSRYGFNRGKEGEIKGDYLLFYTEKGDIGAVLARYGVPRDKIGLCVEIVRDHGGYVKGNTEDEIKKPNPRSAKPSQQALPGIFESTEYDETYHLQPNGKRKRR
ncbi:MAG: hypothetical protein N3D75_03455 [Candidatus Aenigmarchaeota archaeon]|nr:hypothetical protein [Candidatus Aenigmarchaeota archaeon]